MQYFLLGNYRGIFIQSNICMLYTNSSQTFEHLFPLFLLVTQCCMATITRSVVNREGRGEFLCLLGSGWESLQGKLCLVLQPCWIQEKLYLKLDWADRGPKKFSWIHLHFLIFKIDSFQLLQKLTSSHEWARAHTEEFSCTYIYLMVRVGHCGKILASLK